MTQSILSIVGNGTGKALMGILNSTGRWIGGRQRLLPNYDPSAGWEQYWKLWCSGGRTCHGAAVGAVLLGWEDQDLAEGGSATPFSDRRFGSPILGVFFFGWDSCASRLVLSEVYIFIVDVVVPYICSSYHAHAPLSFCADMLVSGHTYFALLFSLAAYQMVKRARMGVIRPIVLVLAILCVSVEMYLVVAAR